jgi:josephin
MKICLEEIMSDQQMYHETQRFYFCGIHALNNLLGGPILTKDSLDEIAMRLAPTSGWWNNPHKSIFGLGNYDVNVLMIALKDQEYETQYLDTRSGKNIWETQLKQQETTALGLICNVQGIWGRHWKAIKFVANGGYSETSTTPTTTTKLFYNLDSKLAAPLKFGSRDEFVQHLTESIEADPNTTLLLISPIVSDKHPDPQT